jgi:hypothetical protein
MNEAVRIPRYEGPQGSTVTVLVWCPIFFILLIGSFVPYLGSYPPDANLCGITRLNAFHLGLENL